MQVDHGKNIIELDRVHFSYDGKSEVLSDVSLKVHRGDYLGLIGPNGAGKTTLLKIMLGLLRPSMGSVKLFGKNLNEFKEWDKIGYVPQKAASFDNNFPATVEEVVRMGRSAKRGLFRFFQNEDFVAVEKALKAVDMLQYKNSLIGDLSGGQQQRVFIARALAVEPEVIFLDEPTVGVDAKTKKEFYDLLQKLNRDFDLTLILISHDMDVVTKEAMHVAYINKTLVYHGSPEELARTKLFHV